MSDSRVHLLIFDLGHQFIANKGLDLIPFNLLPALRTPGLLKLNFFAFLWFWYDQFCLCVIRKARDVELVVAFSAQKHIYSVLFPIFLGYFGLAKEALIPFFFDLHSVVFIFLVIILMVLNYLLCHHLRWLYITQLRLRRLRVRLDYRLCNVRLEGNVGTTPSIRATKNVAARQWF